MRREFSILGLLATGLVVATGTLWAFNRGGQDFDVFYHAWRLVLNGHGAEVYRVSPDRFLYAPGFAWLLSPLALLPRGAALALWCLVKAAVLGLVLRGFGVRIFRNPELAVGAAGWAVLLLARPILIDFQYGQVNLLILAVCLWALLRHFSAKEAESTRERLWDVASWAALAIVAFVKVFPLPLLGIPLLAGGHLSRSRLKSEWIGIIAGLVLVIGLPVIGVGVRGFGSLYLGWADALIQKGFPLESHNQSFAAFLHHYFSGEPTPVIAEGGALLSLGFGFFSKGVIRVLALAWTVMSSGLIFFWVWKAHRYRAPTEWMAILLGLLILPSHLVWKPYFVMGLPLAILAVQRWSFFSWKKGLILYVALFSLVNLTGFDFVGHDLGARFEGGAVLLWAHLLLMGAVLRRVSAPGPSC